MRVAAALGWQRPARGRCRLRVKCGAWRRAEARRGMERRHLPSPAAPHPCAAVTTAGLPRRVRTPLLVMRGAALYRAVPLPPPLRAPLPLPLAPPPAMAGGRSCR
jgi:hypothetical protein